MSWLDVVEVEQPGEHVEIPLCLFWLNLYDCPGVRVLRWVRGEVPDVSYGIEVSGKWPRHDLWRKCCIDGLRQIMLREALEPEQVLQASTTESCGGLWTVRDNSASLIEVFGKFRRDFGRCFADISRLRISAACTQSSASTLQPAERLRLASRSFS